MTKVASEVKMRELSVTFPQESPEYSYLRFPSLSAAPITFKRRRLDADMSEIMTPATVERELRRFEEITREFLMPYQVFDVCFIVGSFTGFILVVAALASNGRTPSFVGGIGVIMVIAGVVGISTVHRFHVMKKVIPKMVLTKIIKQKK